MLAAAGSHLSCFLAVFLVRKFSHVRNEGKIHSASSKWVGAGKVLRGSANLMQPVIKEKKLSTGSR